MTTEDVYTAADAFLKALDAVPVRRGTICKDQTAKEWLETSTHRALRKLDAAVYHSANVTRLVKRVHRTAKTRAAQGGTPGISTDVKHGTVRLATTFAAQEIAYEIDAFLAASRAAVDFGGNIIALHLGMTRRTGITTILDWLKKNSSPPFPFVLEREPWLLGLKAYRDECVHYRTLRSHVGYEVVWHQGVMAEAFMPFTVQEEVSPADDRPDTRDRRALGFALSDDLPEGLSKFETHGSVKAADGTILFSEYSIGYEPAPGYVSAEGLCVGHLNKLREFLTRLFEEVPKLGFALQRRTLQKSTVL